MNLLIKTGGLLLGAFVLIAALEVGQTLSIPGVHSVISHSEAEVGRPLSPVSVAGVARRSNR